MASPRKAIRAAAKAALGGISGLSVSGPRHYARVVGGLPAAEVTAPSEAVSRISVDGDLRRVIDILVSIRAAEAEVDDVLDDLADQVEAALFGSASLQALVKDEFPAQAAFVEFEAGDGGETRPARLSMRFIVQVFDEG